MPENVSWIKECANAFKPEENTVVLRGGNAMNCDYLIIYPGIQLN